MPYIGRLGTLGIGKETAVGTVNTTPDTWLAFVPPETISPDIQLLQHNGIFGKPDFVFKATQGPGSVPSAKFKLIAEPENVGEILMGAFGTDTLTDTASVTVAATNKYIDFKVDAGGELTATLTTGSFAYGTSGATASTLCANIKAAMELATTGARTFTVTYSYTTKKFTIVVDGVHTIQILWNTGTNNANGAYAILGFTKADTADATTQVSNGTTAQPALLHTFSRLANAQLPTYSFYVDKGNLKKMYFAGAMLNKLSIEMKAKEYVMMDADFAALKYDSDGTAAATYSVRRPFTFDQVSVNFAGSSAELDYDNIKIDIDNMVKVEHALSSSIWASKVWSEGFRVTIAADFYLENTTEYAKFLAGTETSLEVTVTSSENIVGTVPYKMTFSIPVMKYAAAPLQNVSGVMKVPFSIVGIYDLASTAKTMSATLQNTRNTVY
jgi:hypothetical protein